MTSLPVYVDDNEKLARAVFYPYHLNKKGIKLKPSFYKAPAGRKDVSVNRLCALSADECKDRARNIPNSDFRGFAVITPSVIRENSSDVVDSRESNYWGHADIMHDFILEKGEPPPPEINKLLQNMVDNSNFYRDECPDDEKWTGDDLK